MNELYKAKYFKTSFGDIPAFTFSMKVKDILHIHYITVKGLDDEEGAVQRVLNKKRIENIKEYVLDGNIFFNSFIVNWTDTNHLPQLKDGYIEIPLINASAQVIDGQHRLAGLDEAIKEQEEIGENKLIVTLCKNITMPHAAKIFLSINTEQHPVPKSLIYDLFGEVADDESHAINRAADIARDLSDTPKSPLYKMIKFPGLPEGDGSIELSTFISSLKGHLGKYGVFYKVNLKSFKHQRDVIFNYFSAIKEFYSHEKIWNSKTKNPFLKAVGFNGGIDYLTGTLIVKCAEHKSFTVHTMKSIMGLERNELLIWGDMKGLDRNTARKKVKEYLEYNLLNSLPEQHEYEF